MKNDILNKKIIIATHYLVYGAPHALREYLINNKIHKLLFIVHPLQIDSTRSYFEIISDGRVYQKKNFDFRTSVPIVNYFFDLFLTVKWILNNKGCFDLFVGVDSLNCFAGIILKKIGKLKKVIFYTIDYVPKRFNNKILNNIYHWFDKFCLRHADETWNVSKRIAKGRENVKGLRQDVYNKQKVVPIGVWFNKIKRLPFDKINKHQLFFVGYLAKKQGVQLVLEAISDIIKKIPDFHFLIVGGGEYEQVLREKARLMNLERYVTFTGWIKDRDQLDQMMADSALSIAMYNKNLDDLTYYADPTKLKDYLSAGLPILLTDVPHNAYEIQDKKCGIIIDYNKDEIVKAIISLLENENKLREYRKNALDYIRQFDWNVIFKNSLKRVL